MIDAMIVGGIMPIVTMTVAAAAFGNELEDRTLYYLVLKPLSRVHIALAKLVSHLRLDRSRGGRQRRCGDRAGRR